MDIIKNGNTFKKLYLKRISTPLRISKRITDMKYKFKQIYKNFYLSTTDLKRQKEMEEYLKYQSKLKYKLQNFIKLTKIDFQEKINIKELYPNKSVRYKENNRLYFNIIIKYDQKFEFQPYLLPIRRRDTIRCSSITETNMLNIVKKIKSNNKKLSMNIFGNRKQNKSNNLIKEHLKSKSALNIKNKNTKNSIKKSFSNNFDSVKLDGRNKNKIIKIKKSLNIENRDNKIIINSPKIIKKRLIDNNIHPLKNIEGILSPIKKENEDINSNENIFVETMKANNEQNNNIENLNNINKNLVLNLDNNEEINVANANVNNIIEPTPNKTINSNYSRNQKEVLLSPNYNSLKNSLDSFKNKIIFKKNRNISLISNDNLNKNTNNEIMTIYELNKNAFKLLPILNKSFNSTMNKSNRLSKNIKSFKKDSKIRTKQSKRKTSKITKKYFRQAEIPTIKSTLRLTKKRQWSKNVDQYIYEDKKGHINFKFELNKKKKSPLTFVEEYNRMRNRRRRNNKKITSNIGFGVMSKQEIKEDKLKAYFGLSFNNNKFY